MPIEVYRIAIPQEVLRLARTEKTPFLAIDESVVVGKFRSFRRAMPDCDVFYAVKANSDSRIIKTLNALGSGFEISSDDELNLLLDCGVKPQRIISSNPMKTISFIRLAHHVGVTDFAFDSYAEIEKLSQYAPGGRVYIRLTVSNDGSRWPLSRKFGVEIEEAIDLLCCAAEASLVPYGITFHVGSQCTDEKSWTAAIKKSKLVWEMVAQKGVRLEMLNLGGGFPVHYTDDSAPSIDRIAEEIKATLREEFSADTRITVEPGRVFVGGAGTLASTVIAKAKRGDEDWLYLDVGVFNGLMESIGGIEYSFATDREGPTKKWVVAGPSCDSVDVISNGIDLPEMEVGDKVYILSAGAYTTAYASRFNGCPIPGIYVY